MPGSVDTFPAGSLDKNPPITILGKVTQYNNTATLGLGMPAITGLDNRSGITVADGAPITLYTVSATANQLFRISAFIYCTAFTSQTSNSYTITWTENTVAKTLVVGSLSAVNTFAQNSQLIRPDASTTITVQLTGTFVATFQLSATVESLA